MSRWPSWAVGAGFVTAEGQPDMPLILKEGGVAVAVLHAVVGTVIPLFLTATMTRLFGPRRSGEGLACWPFALVASLSMTLPYTLVAYVLGPGISLATGSLAGLSFMVWCVRRGWFMPPGSSVWTFGPPAHWDSDWLGEKGGILESAPSSRPMSLWRAWFPYLLVAGLLVLTRLKFLPLVSWLRSVKLEWQHILGSELGVAVELLPPRYPVYCDLSCHLLASSHVRQELSAGRENLCRHHGQGFGGSGLYRAHGRCF